MADPDFQHSCTHVNIPSNRPSTAVCLAMKEALVSQLTQLGTFLSELTSVMSFFTLFKFKIRCIAPPASVV